MNERISKILIHPKTVPVSIGIVSFGIGVGIGYILGKGRNNKTYIHAVPKPLLDPEAMEAFLEQEEARVGISRNHPSTQLQSIPEQMANTDDAVITIREVPPEDEEDSVEQNVFGEVADDEWNYEEELKNRTEEQPYVLHRDEFYGEESGYHQQSLTYYAADNILVDEEDAPIYNHETIVGPLLFGHGSGDSKVFYVRSDKRKAEYEIIFDPGLYSVEVLGLEIENNERANNIKHSAPKFKMME